MVLAGGDMGEYSRIKSGPVGDYLIKLNNWVEGIERQVESSNAQQLRKK